MRVNREGYSELDEAIPAVVKEAMNEHGLTLVEVARRIGIRRATLTRRTSGHIPFTVGLLAAVADAVGSDLLDLVGRAQAAAETGNHEGAPASVAADRGHGQQGAMS